MRGGDAQMMSAADAGTRMRACRRRTASGSMAPCRRAERGRGLERGLDAAGEVCGSSKVYEVRWDSWTARDGEQLVWAHFKSLLTATCHFFSPWTYNLCFRMVLFEGWVSSWYGR